ncbi:hypothetical protein BDF14DRAFT_1135817 [Spinellus fusiger]|nr:hypothetical protein BDF14DRAFT_1135817 [Spinellus fusiger]
MIACPPSKVVTGVPKLFQVLQERPKGRQETCPPDMISVRDPLSPLGHPSKHNNHVAYIAQLEDLLLTTGQRLERAEQHASDYQQQWSSREQSMQRLLEDSQRDRENESTCVRQLSDLVALQHSFIEALQQSLEISPTPSHETTWVPAEISNARAELKVLQAEIMTLQKTKQHLERDIVVLEGELEMSQGQVRMLLVVSEELQDDFNAQTESAKERIKTLEDHLASKENQLQDLLKDKAQCPPTPLPSRHTSGLPPLMAEEREAKGHCRTNSNSTFGSSVTSSPHQLMFVQNDIKADSPHPIDTLFSHHASVTPPGGNPLQRHPSDGVYSPFSRKSYVAKWADIHLPPATPPPSEPLPPLPTTAPMSPLSPIRSHSYSHPHPYSRTYPISLSRPKVLEALPAQAISVNTMTEEGSDTLFTLPQDDQDDLDMDSTLSPAPTQISVTREIDEVYAWQANNSDFPRGTKWMDDPEADDPNVMSRPSSSSEKTHSPFWKGMRKKWKARESK